MLLFTTGAHNSSYCFISTEYLIVLEMPWLLAGKVSILNLSPNHLSYVSMSSFHIILFEQDPQVLLMLLQCLLLLKYDMTSSSELRQSVVVLTIRFADF